jgi:hypothetical protein
MQAQATCRLTIRQSNEIMGAIRPGDLRFGNAGSPPTLAENVVDDLANCASLSDQTWTKAFVELSKGGI